jgi:hypothetical protein
MAAQSIICEEIATGDVAAASVRLGTPARSAPHKGLAAGRGFSHLFRQPHTTTLKFGRLAI